MKKVLLFALTISCGVVFGQKQEKYSKARVYYNENTWNQLLKSGIPLDHGVHKPGVFFEGEFSQSEMQKISQLGYSSEIIIDDIQKHYLERNELNTRSNFKNSTCQGGGNNDPIISNPTNYNHGSMGGFLTYDEVMREIDSMALLYPTLITPRAAIDTFKTFEGRNLHWIKISDNANIDENEPQILYDAIHHAREPMSVQQLVFYMWYLLENYATNSEIKAIIDNSELYFVPFVNPDGYVYNETTNPNGGGMWRKNRFDHQDANGNFGVDNNRNYDYIDGTNGSVWGTTGISTDPSSDVHCGPSAFSEPENQAMRWFVNQHDFKVAFNNHSYSNLLLYPFGFEYGRQCPDSTEFETISSEMVKYNNYANQVGWELYPTSGGSDDWMYGATTEHNKIYSFTPEIGSPAQGFWPVQADINDLCHSTLHMNLIAAHLLNNYAKTIDLQPLMIENSTGYFKYNITRLGLEGTGDFTVAITPILNIDVVGATMNHNGMALYESLNDSISYTLNPTITPGDEIKYVVTTDNGIFTTNDTISKIYGLQQTIFTDNGNGLSNWTPTGSWNVTTNDFYSASSSITDSPNGNYIDEENSTITLNNNISLVNATVASMSYYAKWEIEAGWDYVQVEVSTDNGNSWIPQCGNYTKLGSANQDENQPLYDGTQNSWVLEEIDLSDYLGENILIRFQLISDQYQTRDGFYFDDFNVKAVYATGLNDLANNNITLQQNQPNPTDNTTNIFYNVKSKDASLHIIDNIGREVFNTKLNPSNHSITIDTESLKSGVYHYFISTEKGKSEVKKMMKY